jgi:ABC-type phosphate transport system ATPase subunit
MQQAARVCEYTAFMYLGEPIEFYRTRRVSDPHRARRRLFAR